MIENKKLINFPSKFKHIFTNNGSGGYDSFVQSVTEEKSKKKERSFTFHLRNFKSKKPIMWNDTFINPPKLDISGIKSKKITEVLKRGNLDGNN